MRIRDVFYIILIVLIGLSINNLLKIKETGLPTILQFGGKANYFTDIKEAAFDRGSSLDIQNSHGKVEMISWDQDSVKAELEKVIYTHNIKLAEEISEKIQLSLTQDHEITRIYTNRDEVPFRGLNVRTNMKIYLPAVTSASLALAHGDMIIHDLKGNFKIKTNHSDVEAENIVGNIFVHGEYGDLLLESIEGTVDINLSQAESTISTIHDRLTLNMKHSTAEIENSLDDVIITAQHSAIEAQEIKGKFQADCENTEIYARQITGDTFITNNHKDIILGDIGGQLKIDSKHCDIEVERVSLNATILSEYGEISFAIPSHMSFSADLLAKNGDIESDFDSLSPVEEDRGTSLTGSIGEGGPLYKIETSYNDIYLEELNTD